MYFTMFMGGNKGLANANLTVTMMRFSETLVRLRKEAGFHTSYAFYHRNGGRRTFPFTYAYYAKIERGQGLPRGEWLDLFLQLLRIRSREDSRRRLVVDYLRDLMGDEKAFDALVDPLLKSSDLKKERAHG
jgi:hypothetical protein